MKNTIRDYIFIRCQPQNLPINKIYPSMPRITVLNNPDAVYEFDSGCVTIGRASECQICIPQKGVSRKHATLTYTDEGWLLEDLDSHNGLFLHNTRIKSALLKHSTNFRVGDAYLHMELPMSRQELLEMATQAKLIVQEFSGTVLGRNNIGKNLLIAAIAGGSVLLNGGPGQAKSLAASTMAGLLGLDCRKIPLTPDTQPADVLGNEVFITENGNDALSPRFVPGPIFSHAIVADEINRAPGKTQAALIEAVAMGKVPVANQFEQLPKPLFLVATQNTLPDDSATPLSAGLLDNFAMSLDMDYPQLQDEIRIIAAETSRQRTAPQAFVTMDSLLDLQELLPTIPVEQPVLEYAGTLARLTRPNNHESPDFIKKNLLGGASTKAATDLIMCAKARALLEGRDRPGRNDVRELAICVLRHRIILAGSENKMQTADDIIRRLLVAIP